MNDKERKKIIDDFFKDEKGCEHRPMDRQDVIVVVACFVAVVLLLFVSWGWI